MSQVLVAMVAASVALVSPAKPASKNGVAVASKADRKALADAALKAFKAGDHATAIEKFTAAYELENHAEDLFNIGRVHEAAGHPDEARTYYERFIKEPGISDEHKAMAEHRLEVLAAPTATDAAAGSSTVDTELSRREQARQAGMNDKPGQLHWATITGAAIVPAGAATLIAGGVLASVAKRNGDDARATADGSTPLETTPPFVQARRQAMAADAMLITGGILTATGLVFVLAGLEKQRRSRKAQQVQVQPGVASLTVRYRF